MNKHLIFQKFLHLTDSGYFKIPATFVSQYIVRENPEIPVINSLAKYMYSDHIMSIDIIACTQKSVCTRKAP